MSRPAVQRRREWQVECADNTRGRLAHPRDGVDGPHPGREQTVVGTRPGNDVVTMFLPAARIRQKSASASLGRVVENVSVTTLYVDIVDTLCRAGRAQHDPDVFTVVHKLAGDM
jgi:hypothetical protein